MPPIAALLLLTPSIHAESSLHFDGADDHVTMGEASELGQSEFTLECWFRWDGEGSETASSGSGGTVYYPLVDKGRGESDGGTQDMNYGLGIDASSGALTADFEDFSSGSNHPVVGITDARDGMWHHAAVTYDGSAWALYLDGALDGSADTGGATPRFDSIQHLAVGTALNSGGSPAGRFRGAIDEVRIWSEAREHLEIRDSMNSALTHGLGLEARWGFDEGAGTTAADSVGLVDGTIVGATWAAQAPFDANSPPDSPVLVEPADGSSTASHSPRLAVQASDPEGDELEVGFYGRPMSEPAEDFTIVVLPDTQYYCAQRYDGLPDMFYAQTQWIAEQRDALNIVYVAHVGDLVDSGDNDPDEWVVADNALTYLEDPDTTGLLDGIPYGVAPGNHDQTPGGDPDGTTTYYNQYFGVERFEDRAYYGGSYGGNNDEHYALFTASGLDFIVIDLEYDQSGVDMGALTWADGLLDSYPDHRAIVVAHHLLESDGSFSDQGELVYGALGHHDNLFLSVCGHLTGELWRSDPAGESGTFYSLMADYQFDGDGGAGWLRIMQFSPAEGTIHVSTYSPWLDSWQDDDDSLFDLPYDMDPGGWTLLGSDTVPAESQASLRWQDLSPDSSYQWFAQVQDAESSTSGEIWSFTAGEGEPDTGDSGTPLDDTSSEDDDDDDDGTGDCGCAARGAAPACGWLVMGLLLGTARLRRRQG